MALIPSAAFCQCCTPDAAPAPLHIVNRPGLSEIAWRSGSHATIRQAMIEAIATGPRNPAAPDDPAWPQEIRSALSGLTTRDDADYAILLIDLFAAVADVLHFHSERIANEIFLRTATDRDSLLRLVRLIGYRLSPGMAASTVLAFRLDPGAALRIRPGIRVMSVPGQDEAPQTFETIGAIAADARLNDLPVFGAPQPVLPFARGLSRLPILSRPDRLLRGDTIAVAGGDVMQMIGVRTLEAMPDGEYLALDAAVDVPDGAAGSVAFKVQRPLRFFGHDVPDSYGFYDANPALAPALRWKTRTANLDYPVGFGANQTRYPLDGRIDDLKPGALLLVDRGAGVAGRYDFALVTTIAQDKAELGPRAGSVTWVGLQRVAPQPGGAVLAALPGQSLQSIPDRRAARIFELLRPAIVPRRYLYPPMLAGGSAFLRRDHLDDPALLTRRQRILIAAGADRHLAVITGITPHAAGSDGVAHAEIGFAPPLGLAVAGARLNGNIAPASHGEIQPDETLGHGDGSRPFQRFRLQRKPLTRLPGATGILPRAELALRVNGELWEEVPSLFGRGPADRVYTLRDDDDGATTIGFGDGRTGARLPSGAGNVVARYRKGLGLAGRLRADQLTTLLDRPVGLRAATNPLPPDGGADPETLEDARGAAPATVRTFGRAIALQDFEDVARQTGLVARCRASWAWIGIERAIQLTIAGPDGTRLSLEAMRSLHAALGTARDPNHLLILGNLWRVPLVIRARILRAPAFEAEAVGEAARTALLELLSFARQPLGRALHLSQVVAALQSAAGVAAVQPTRFHVKGFAGWSAAQLARRGATAAPVQPHVRLFDARPRSPAASLDPLALAGLALEPDALALPAEQAFVAVPETDLDLAIVEAL